jgi:hypothetical protein
MKKAILISILLVFILSTPVYAQEQDPWSEVFLPDGSLNPSLIDLGETSEAVDWMTIDLPFGQSIELEANYHRYQTESGNMVVMPSASTLFFMAVNAEESGLADSYESIGNGHANMINVLGRLVGDNLDWNKVQLDHPEYKQPDQFWSAVINGEQDVWSYFSGWSFITQLKDVSLDDAAYRSIYLLYLNGTQTCTNLPGQCSGVVIPLVTTHICPEPTIAIQEAMLVIEKLSPAYPLVIGQDTQLRRGADVEISITIPPVIFTWYEPIYEEREICRSAGASESPNCNTGSGSLVDDGVHDIERIFKECREHVEHLPDAVTSLQANAALDAGSQAWIIGTLGQTHYEAYLHHPSFSLVPGLAPWSGGCAGNGTCTASSLILRIPVEDPGTYLLGMDIRTSGTQFQGVTITYPRQLHQDGLMNVYVTLPAITQ